MPDRNASISGSDTGRPLVTGGGWENPHGWNMSMSRRVLKDCLGLVRERKCYTREITATTDQGLHGTSSVFFSMGV